MNRPLNPIISSFAILFLLQAFGTVLAQDNRSDLEAEKEKLEGYINYTSTLLDETRFEKKTTLKDLALINNKIENRKKLISNYNQKIELLYDTLFNRLIEINSLAQELSRLKDEYARMLYCAYQNQNLYQRVLYVVAAESFNQAYQRMSYYRFYAEKRKQQALKVKQAEENYMAEVEFLEQKAKKTEILLSRVRKETLKLEREKQIKNKAVMQLARREKELVQNQEELQADALKLKNRIEQIIAEDMASSSSGQLSAGISLTPEQQLISKNFSANRGKLPWPSERGVISSRFGEHDHPEIKGIKIKNNGINIITHPNSKARAIFDGEVTRVVSVPNYNNVVIIRHGQYLTVYSNLREVFVETGNSVNSMQEIGTIFTDENERKTELHFEIWKGKGLLDPTVWLASENSSGLLHIDTP